MMVPGYLEILTSLQQPASASVTPIKALSKHNTLTSMVLHLSGTVGDSQEFRQFLELPHVTCGTISKVPIFLPSVNQSNLQFRSENTEVMVHTRLQLGQIDRHLYSGLVCTLEWQKSLCLVSLPSSGKDKSHICVEINYLELLIHVHSNWLKQYFHRLQPNKCEFLFKYQNLQTGKMVQGINCLQVLRAEAQIPLQRYENARWTQWPVCKPSTWKVGSGDLWGNLAS